MSRGVAYYNEIDPFAAAWLRELIKAGHIAPGEVDERSIEDVTPNDLAGFVQCHFFAGIGVWSYALRRAGWPDDKPAWTGSCPCQPFSSAGKGAGFADERHLWPALYHLIGQRRPDHVFGEQVASKDGLAWLNLVQTDLENAAYTCGVVDTCAAGFGAPHIRQRLYWVAHAEMRGHIGGNVGDETGAKPKVFGRWKNEWRGGDEFTHGREDVRLANTLPTGRPPWRPEPGHGQAAGGFGAVGISDSPANGLDKGRQCFAATGGNGIARDRTVGGLEHTHIQGLERRERTKNSHKLFARSGSMAGGLEHTRRHEVHGEIKSTEGHEEINRSADEFSRPGKALERPGPTNGQWRDVDWLFCRDGKWRTVRPGTFPLAHGAPARVGRLRGYGNAICAAQAEEFIRAYMEVIK